MLSEGKSIASVSIEKEMGKDDDWIVLTFSDDPAIKPFSAPAKK